MAPNNPLSSWGNEKTMNLNTLILTNIQSSPYFKVGLFELKTFHEVVDEIYYKVDHLEPWEKGSRKTAGQTGMCGGVRGVGAGGIVSSAYCLLFKLFTLKLTKKQVNNLITHADSPYIRGLGFMYIRYSQQPGDLWDWYEPYLDDDEELDVKAGGGHMMTIGEMLRQWLVKLEWYSTLFPRIPVPIQKDLDIKLRSRPVVYGFSGYGQEEPESTNAKEPEHIPDDQVSFGEAERSAQTHRGNPSSNSGRGRGGIQDSYSNGNNYRRSSPQSRRRSPPRRSPNRDDFSRELEREKDRQKREKEKDQPRHGDRDKRRSRSKSRDNKRRSRSRDGRRSRSRSRDRKMSRRSGSRERAREDKSSGKDRDRDYYKDSSSKDKDRDYYKDNSSKDRDRDYYKDNSSKDKDSNSKEKDKDYYKDSSSKEHKKHKKSHKHSKDKSRDKERGGKDASRERDRHSNRDRERDISRERERHRERKYSS